MNKTLQDKLPITSQEWDELINLFFYSKNQFSKEQITSATLIHPLALKHPKGASSSSTANFLFECYPCKLIGDNPWYKIILDTIGGFPFLKQHTNEDDLRKGFTDSNLSKISEIDNRNYPESGINFVEKVGYVCDHCRENVFAGDEWKQFFK